MQMMTGFPRYPRKIRKSSTSLALTYYIETPDCVSKLIYILQNRAIVWSITI